MQRQRNAEAWLLGPDLPLTLQATLSQTAASLGSSVLIYKKKGLDQVDNERYLSNNDPEVSRKERAHGQIAVCTSSGCLFLPSCQPDVTALCTKQVDPGDFPGGPVVRTLRFHCRGTGSIPGQGAKILHATWLSQKLNKTNKQNKLILGCDGEKRQ